MSNKKDELILIEVDLLSKRMYNLRQELKLLTQQRTELMRQLSYVFKE